MSNNYSDHPWTRRHVLITAGTVPISVISASGVGGAAESRTSGWVFTADEKAGSISAIDLRTGGVRTVALSIMPHNVQVTPDGRMVLLVGMGMAAGHAPDGTGRLIVLGAGDIVRPPLSNIIVGPHPAHVVTDLSGARAFITDSARNAVLVVPLAAAKIEREIAVGSYPHGLRLSPDGRELFIANMRSNDVSVVDVATLTEIKRIPVGKAPVQVAFTPDGAQVFVSLNGENKVAIIDRVSRSVAASLPVGRNPVQLQATPDGRLVFVANQGTAAAPDDTVSVINVAQRLIVARVRSGRGAHGVTGSNDGRRIFISNIVDSTVSVIDVQSLKTITNHKVGAGPNGISFLAAP